MDILPFFFLFSTSTNRLFFLWYGEGCKGGLQIWGDGGYQRSWAAWCEIHREQKRSLKKLKWAQWGWRNECLAWKCSAVDSAFVAWAGFGWGSGVVRMLSVLVLPGKLLLPSHLCLYLHLQQLKLPPTTAAASGHLPFCSSRSARGWYKLWKVPGCSQAMHTLLSSLSGLRIYGARAVVAGILMLQWVVCRAPHSGPPMSPLVLSGT